MGKDFDAWMLTVLASGLNAKGAKCGIDREECTPEVVNRIYGDNYQTPSEAYRLMGI